VAVVSPGQVAAEMLCETVNVGDDQIHWGHSSRLWVANLQLQAFEQ
jgi:hypothetical protein